MAEKGNVDDQQRAIGAEISVVQEKGNTDDQQRAVEEEISVVQEKGNADDQQMAIEAEISVVQEKKNADDEKMAIEAEISVVQEKKNADDEKMAVEAETSFVQEKGNGDDQQMAVEAELLVVQEKGNGDDQQMAVEEETLVVQMERAVNERGIDVSHWQGKIDWGRVAKAGIKHVCMKMSEGANYVDPRFVENWNGAKSAGIHTGCYHYFLSPNCEPEKQMANIKKNTTAVKFDPTINFLAIDVEERGNEKATPSQIADSLNALLTLIKKDDVLSCGPVMIYTSYGFWDSKVLWNKYNFAAYPLWVAHWGVQSPRLPEPWKKAGKYWSWWQHSSLGQVEGIDGAVDLNWVRVLGLWLEAAYYSNIPNPIEDAYTLARIST